MSHDVPCLLGQSLHLVCQSPAQIRAGRAWFSQVLPMTSAQYISGLLSTLPAGPDSTSNLLEGVSQVLALADTYPGWTNGCYQTEWVCHVVLLDSAQDQGYL